MINNILLKMTKRVSREWLAGGGDVGRDCDWELGLSQRAALSDDEIRPNKLLKLIAFVFALFVFAKYAKWAKYEPIWVGSEGHYDTIYGILTEEVESVEMEVD